MSTDASVSRFRNLSIHGFRRLNDVVLDLRPLTVMIGANGSGKTSVLEGLSLLANSAQGVLRQSISDLSGLPGVLTYDHAETLELGISMKVPDKEDWLYLLRLRPLGQGYEIEEESLNQGGILYIMARPLVRVDYYDADQRRTIHPNWEYVPFETSLSQVPKMFREPEDFRKRLASSTYYHVLNVDPRSPVRLPQPMQPAMLPGRNGEELVSCLFNLRESERDRFEAIEDALRAAFPGFERLDFPPVAAGTLALAWREKGFSKPLYMHQLSEGTLRFLWLATLLASPGLTALTLLDEPEVSLHPELLNILSDLFREASTRTQLVVATHSDRLIRFLKPEEVVVIDSDEDGMSTLTWADKLDLEEWLKEYSLDELWSNGRIGARP
jgi:predicted ATPase